MAMARRQDGIVFSVFLIGLMLSGPGGCLNNSSSPASSDDQPLGQSIKATSLRQPLERMVQSMVEAVVSTQGPQSVPATRLLIVQFHNVTNNTDLAGKAYLQFTGRLRQSLIDIGKSYSVLFTSSSQRQPIAAHRLQIVLNPIAESKNRTCLVQMSLRGPDYTGRITRLWEDSAIVPIP